MARYELYDPASEAKKDGRLRRFCAWLCLPFRRGSDSYIEQDVKIEMSPSPSPPVQEVKLVPKHPLPQHPFNNPSSTLYQAHEEKLVEEVGQPRGRYREARPQHPASYTIPPQSQPISNDQVDFVRKSSLSVTRGEVESPTYDAPQPDGKRRSHSKTDKNKDLPGVLRAEPPRLTNENLEWHERRHSAGSRAIDNIRGVPTSYLIDSIPDAPNLHIRRWSNDSRRSVRPDMRSQIPGNEQRGRGQYDPRHMRSSFDGHQGSHSRQSSGTRKSPQNTRSRQSSATRQTHPSAQPSQSSATWHTAPASPPRQEQDNYGGNLPSRRGIVPLRDDSDRVLVHSRSRGYKIVRNLLSLDGLRDGAQPRHAKSLEEIAAEERRSNQEFASQYSCSLLSLFVGVE
jgi:hypothetical protein